MSAPELSFVVAAYRSDPRYLETALRSALSQTMPDVEVLVGDDSPDDRLRDLVRGMHDSRLSYHHNPTQLGTAANHWALLGRARAPNVSVLNHDDWVSPEFAARMVATLNRHPDAVLAFCDHWLIDAQGRRLDEETERNSRRWGRDGLATGMHRPFLDLLVRQSVPLAMGTALRRSALPTNLPTDAGAAYDLWLTYLLARGGSGAAYLDQRLSAWRQHPDSQTSAVGLGWLQGSASCWIAMTHDPACSTVRAAARDRAALALYACAMRSWGAGHRYEGVRHGLRSLGAKFTWRGMAACALSLLPPRLAPARWRSPA